MGIEPIRWALQTLQNAVFREAPMAACDWRANFRVLRDNVGQPETTIASFRSRIRPACRNRQASVKGIHPKTGIGVSGRFLAPSHKM